MVSCPHDHTWEGKLQRTSGPSSPHILRSSVYTRPIWEDSENVVKSVTFPKKDCVSVQCVLHVLLFITHAISSDLHSQTCPGEAWLPFYSHRFWMWLQKALKLKENHHNKKNTVHRIYLDYLTGGWCPHRVSNPHVGPGSGLCLRELPQCACMQSWVSRRP